MCEEEEIIEEESPQFPAAFGLVQPTAVEQLARPEAVSQRVEDQVLGESREGSTIRLRRVTWREGNSLVQSVL